MRFRNFRGYRLQFEPEFRKIVAAGRNDVIDEQALPSYANPNPLMSWLFWERIRTVFAELGRTAPGRTLDFGCGSGVLLPRLLELGAEVHACDLDLTLAKRLAESQGWKNRVQWHPGAGSLGKLPAGAFDTIICLDVLEHVDALPALVDEFARLLSPLGRIIVSGPTESLLYKLGRRLAGFSGHYHVRDIYDIEQELARRFEMRLVRKLVWPVTLFRITMGRPLST